MPASLSQPVPASSSRKSPGQPRPLPSLPLHAQGDINHLTWGSYGRHMKLAQRLLELFGFVRARRCYLGEGACC